MTETRSARRIPPESELLEFARTSTTGTVHVVGYGPDSYWVPLLRRENPEAAAILGLLSSPRRMLCGTRLLVSSVDGQQAVWESGDAFADDDLCEGCVRAMGDQSWRAFHADNRGPGLDD